MMTPPANVEVLDNSTTPRENTGARQFAKNLMLIKVRGALRIRHYNTSCYEDSSGCLSGSSTCLYGHSDGVVSVVLHYDVHLYGVSGGWCGGD